MTLYNKQLGNSGEDSAAVFFVERGFDIVARNFTAGRSGELDLVVKKDNLLVFVEVKTRTGNVYGGALYSISEKKKKSMRLAARIFILKNSPIYDKYDMRFDLLGNENGKLVWIEDIIR